MVVETGCCWGFAVALVGCLVVCFLVGWCCQGLSGVLLVLSWLALRSWGFGVCSVLSLSVVRHPVWLGLGCSSWSGGFVFPLSFFLPVLMRSGRVGFASPLSFLFRTLWLSLLSFFTCLLCDVARARGKLVRFASCLRLSFVSVVSTVFSWKKALIS